VRGGSASTLAGSTNAHVASFIVGGATASNARNGEVPGTMMRSPTRENALGAAAEDS
jgi:hypothetical protein